MLLQNAPEMGAVEHVELAAVDELVRQQVGNGDARLEVAPPITGKALRGEVQHGDRGAGRGERGRGRERGQRQAGCKSNKSMPH